MITLSPTSALMLYLCLTLTVLLGIWAFSHWSTRKKEIVVSEQELYVCEYCQSAYVAESQKGVTQCPDCGSYNKDNLYKT
jgi:ribosomal protein L37AE/L43A